MRPFLASRAFREAASLAQVARAAPLHNRVNSRHPRFASNRCHKTRRRQRRLNMSTSLPSRPPGFGDRVFDPQGQSHRTPGAGTTAGAGGVRPEGTEAGEVTAGAEVVTADGRSLPLVSARLTGTAQGGLARLVLEQRFDNHGSETLHA